MKRRSCFLLLFAFVLILAPAKGGNNTNTNNSNISPPNTVNSTKENITDLSRVSQRETSNSSESTDSKESIQIKETNRKETEENGEKLLSDSNVEECDPANRCMDETEKFIACLRVPGTDSLALSLLIENRGTGSLEIYISALDFVDLEQAKVKLNAKEHKEVKVSIREGANDTTIVLRTGEGGNCTLNLRNTIATEPSRTWSGYTNLFTRVASICVLVACLSLLAITYLCIKFFRNPHRQEGGGPTYQKLDMELPISTGGKNASKDNNDDNNWDDNWGNGWDDEEAPLTPSKPFSKPNSKGLASRKISKDMWKD